MHTRIDVSTAIVLLLAPATMAASLSTADLPRQHAIEIVAQIQRADYEGDRAALKNLPLRLLPFVEDKNLGVPARYWRGFALWRRALNGFNESVPPNELEADLQDAVSEFEKATERDPNFVEAKIGITSCMGNILYLHRKDQAQVQAYVARLSLLLQDLKDSDVKNPRLYWVLGPMYWSRPSDRGGGQEKAFEAYRKGLEAISLDRKSADDPLQPSWGEPELLMNLAWSNLNRTEPDLEAAERYAKSALQLVPYWHYVRDILMPQIQAAKEKKVAQ